MLLPPRASEERPWLGLVTCLSDPIWEMIIKLLKGWAAYFVYTYPKGVRDVLSPK